MSPVREVAASACTIAGSDSGGSAGIQADLRTFALHRVHGASAVTALTAQNTVGVQDVWPVPPAFVRAQMDSVFDDLCIGGVKTGMLGSPELIETVAAKLRTARPDWVVVDPVMVSSTGARLLPEAGEAALRETLLPMADVVTPNLWEAGILLGGDVALDRRGREEAAAELHARIGCAVLLKGGHAADDADDCLAHGGRLEWLSGARVDTPHTHGTGCHLSSAIASRLIRGAPLAEAAAGAKAWLAEGLRRAMAVGQGRSGPWPEPVG